jgi:hypothetical protein
MGDAQGIFADLLSLPCNPIAGDAQPHPAPRFLGTGKHTRKTQPNRWDFLLQKL